MARTTAPLLSFGASGQIGKSLVFGSWKGRAYGRRYTIPSNPNTSAQQLTRNTFRWLNDAYRYLPTGALGAWDAYAQASAITSRNAWQKINLANLRTEVDLANLIVSVAAKGGVVAQSMVLTPAATQITVDLTEPQVPTGWTITQAHALAIVDQDPQTDTNFLMTYGFDASAPYSIVLTGLEAATQYLVGGWFEFLRPDGFAAYGVSLQDVATTP